MTKHSKVVELASNLPFKTEHQDILLQNSWGLVIHNDTLWVANNVSNVLTNYDLKGRKLSPGTVVLPQGFAQLDAEPTGIVVNHTRGFVIEQSPTNRAASMLIAVSKSGVIWGYNPLVDPNNAYIAVDYSNDVDHPVYTGCTIAGNYLFATDFYNNKIDVFDFNFVPVTTFLFTDSNTGGPVPVEFAPYNIVNINNKLYVTYAKPLAPNNTDVETGLGNGYVNVFDLDGVFIRRLASEGLLDTPWGVSINPSCEGTLLIGNNGDGKINVFGKRGADKGQLKTEHSNIISIEGLYALVKHEKVVYFTAGPNLGVNGVVGKIKFC
jgi:uncharacterized protein (TIGR03118 family)